jgi:hypothetical protein
MDRRMYHYRRAAVTASDLGGGHVKDVSVAPAGELERIPTQCRPTTDGLHDLVQDLLSAS